MRAGPAQARRPGPWAIRGLALVLAMAVLVVWSGLAARFLLSHQAGLVYHAALRAVESRLPAGAGHDQALAALRDYVHALVRPVGREQDLGPVRVLLNGKGWCDQQCDIYLRLVEPWGVRGCLAFLQDAQGKSPHSVALLAPGAGPTPGWPGLRGGAMVVDVYYGVTFQGPGGEPASPQNICAGRYQPRLKEVDRDWFCRPPRLALCNRPLAGWPAPRRWLWRAWGWLPASWERGLISLAVATLPGLEEAQRAYLQARVEHLTLGGEKARIAYADVERRYPDTPWAALAAYYGRGPAKR
ncbi:MAG: hypothetical protein KQH53_13500 [Desulfarculaceae bacterium]|nr:hypothetical protein [Desulfarculaceae bacterium]